MSGEQHFLLTAGGSYASDNTALAGEVWQTGTRLLVVPGGAPDAIGALAASWDIVPDSIDRDETECTITGNWRAEGGVSDFSPDDYLYDIAMPAWATFFFASKAFMSSNCRLEWLKLYPIAGPDGHTIPAPPQIQGTPCLLEWKTPITGSNGGVMLPPQCSPVISTRTGKIGRRGRGRMFLPAPTNSIIVTGATNGTIGPSQRSDLAGVAADLVEGLVYNGPNPLYGPHVAAIVTGKPYTDYAMITSVRVGNVIDTQQRRRRQIDEIYTSAPVSI